MAFPSMFHSIFQIIYCHVSSIMFQLFQSLLEVRKMLRTRSTWSLGTLKLIFLQSYFDSGPRFFRTCFSSMCTCRYLELEAAEFEMGTVMDAVISQGMSTSREKGLQIIRETPREISTMRLFGDQIRLQQVLSDFLLNAVRFTPSSEGWVKIKVVPTRKRVGGNLHVMNLEFRWAINYTHSPSFCLCGSLNVFCLVLSKLSWLVRCTLINWCHLIFVWLMCTCSSLLSFFFVCVCAE